jgi:hypothetical protein
MKCPKCGDSVSGSELNAAVGKSRVYDTRETPEGGIRRRRACQSCGHRFTTIEIVVLGGNRGTPVASRAGFGPADLKRLEGLAGEIEAVAADLRRRAAAGEEVVDYADAALAL